MYYIYHIEGVKIGCTKRLVERMKEQGFDNYSILETHDDINTASKRELELQKEYGYKVDTMKYSNLYEHIGNKGGKIGGKIVGANNRDSGHLKLISTLGGKVQGMINKEKYSIPIVVYHYPSMEFVNEFPSIKEASRKLNIEKSLPNIIAVLKGKGKSVKGYTFNYKVS